jgi:hypothetical protein
MLTEPHIVPSLGTTKLQKLASAQTNALYGDVIDIVQNPI